MGAGAEGDVKESALVPSKSLTPTKRKTAATILSNSSIEDKNKININNEKRNLQKWALNIYHAVSMSDIPKTTQQLFKFILLLTSYDI